MIHKLGRGLESEIIIKNKLSFCTCLYGVTPFGRMVERQNGTSFLVVNFTLVCLCYSSFYLLIRAILYVALTNKYNQPQANQGEVNCKQTGVKITGRAILSGSGRVFSGSGI